MANKGKKNFAVNTDPVYNDIAMFTAEPEQEAEQEPETQEAPEVPEVQEAPAAQKTRKTYTQEEAKKYLEEMRTTGRKGLKLPRLNMAFVPDIYEYINVMSRVRGESMTQFVNAVLRQHMEEHQDIFDKALEFRKML